ncbi:MAG: EAL domain-containing protein [Spirulinaceae cyanobacterium RM2_2_10]|nr:EAL domain-containing protein [Spirulinaceae cyanobacterium SM2_1_0]NJO20838.1 EAL domain-containing protein [Spirulinaceae cyanobacterium RM2_2_10]
MATYKADILIVDDTPENLKLLSTMLAAQSYKVRSVTSGVRAIQVAKTVQPDLILLDIKMPTMDGYQVCQQLKHGTSTSEIPIIFLSALDETFDKVKAFNVGGIDYITKPFQLEEVLVRIETQLQLQTARRSLQALNDDLEQRVRQRTQQLEQEIAARQKAQERLLHLALHDSLTELPNRAFLMQRLQQVLSTNKQNLDSQFAVLFLDCDRFKIVNNSLGHPVGDQLLVALSRRLQSCVPAGSMIARLGGDEFVILLENLRNPATAIGVVERIHAEMRLPFQLEEHQFLISISIGVVLGDHTYTQPEHLLRDADAAMYAAKSQHHAGYTIFSQNLHNRAISRFQLEVDLQQAVKQHNFFACYQPIVTLGTGEVIGFEALVRWQHYNWGLVPPGEFVPIAEEAGFVSDIDLWMLRQACQQLADWQQQGLLHPPFRLGINCSARHFTRPDFIAEVDRLLTAHQLDGCWLAVEITERELVTNAEAALVILRAFRARCIHVAIDDFGTGYSGLSYLQNFPIDTLKVDRSFISSLGELEPNDAVVRAILALADSLGMMTIAEGVETVLQRERLAVLGCQLAQGYLFAPPMTAGEATALLETRQRLPQP